MRVYVVSACYPSNPGLAAYLIACPSERKAKFHQLGPIPGSAHAACLAGLLAAVRMYPAPGLELVTNQLAVIASLNGYRVNDWGASAPEPGRTIAASSATFLYVGNRDGDADLDKARAKVHELLTAAVRGAA